jgi:hypothetical protein
MAQQISTLPTPPTTADPENFDVRADAFLGALPTFQEEANLLSTEVNAINTLIAGTFATSTTSLSVGTGTRTPTVETGKAFTQGMPVTVYRTTDTTQYMSGTVTSYVSGTGVLTLNITSSGGSGTYTNWSIASTAPVTVPSAVGSMITMYQTFGIF